MLSAIEIKSLFQGAGAVDGGTLNFNTFTLSGTTVLQNVVSLFGGDALPVSAETDAADVQNFTFATSVDGVRSFTATAMDVDSNTSAASLAFTRRVDPQVLTVPDIMLFSSSTGDLSDGGAEAEFWTLAETDVAQSAVNLFDGDCGARFDCDPGVSTFMTDTSARSAYSFTAAQLIHPAMPVRHHRVLRIMNNNS